jgi:hypothetical protein
MCKLCEQLKKEKGNIEIYEVIVNRQFLFYQFQYDLSDEECNINYCPLCGEKIE